MSYEHVISDELLKEAEVAFSRNECWIAYNTIPYFLDASTMYFFKTSDEAHEFSDNNISEYDNYRVLHAYSIDELLKQFSYGENLERQLTDPDTNGLYNKDGNAFTDALIEHMEQQQILNNKKLSIMNERNFEYLKDNLKYLGFGEMQNDALETNLKEGKESFQLAYSAEVNKKPFEAVLNFRRSDSSDMYFLNSYLATLEHSNGEKMEQTFYLNKGKGVTAKEAYNLLEGRAVHKELTNKAGEPYKAWIQLDFEKKDKNNNFEVSQYHENYGYDLKAAVGKFAIMEMDGADKEKALLQSLQKGNIQAVTVGVNGEAQRMFIEANPEYKTITLYNNKMQRLDQDQRLEILEKQAVKELKEEKVLKEDQQLDKKQDNKKSIGHKAADELGQPKKKSSRKKGMSM